MKRIGLGIGIVALACGPSVGVPSEEGEGSSAPTTTEGTTSGSEDEGDAGSSGVFDEGSGSPPAFCGNGVVEGIEACDDGNDVDADGCSRSCEVSGSVSWRVELEPEYGVGVGLDARDGEAYVLVEDYHGGGAKDLDAISTRVSTLGEIVAQYRHAGGLADLDVAREAIASMPGGEVVVGYLSPEGSLFRLQLDTGPVWADAMFGWSISAATRWFGGEVFTLRRASDGGQFALLRFTDTGELLDTWWLDDASNEARPLRVGALFPRGGFGAVALTLEPDDQLRMHSFFGGDAYSIEVGTPGPDEPRAFAHELEIAIWTTTERITIDMFDHPIGSEPRIVPGFVLTSFVGGFAILDGSRIDVYDDAGVLRWSHEAPATPRLAMVDGIGGLFVLSDGGLDAGNVVVLERLVL